MNTQLPVMHPVYLLIDRLRDHLCGFTSAFVNYTHFKEQYNQLLPRLQRGECLCLCPASLGDTLLFFEYKSIIEKQHQLTCFPLIKPSHQTVAKLCGVKEYAVIQDTRAFLRWLILYHKGRNLAFKDKLGFKVIHPQKGKTFITHFGFSCEQPTVSCHEKAPAGWLFLCTHLKSFNLPEDTPRQHTLRLERIAPAPVPPGQKRILLAPEALSLHLPLLTRTWVTLAQHLQQRGYTVVYNALKEDKHLSQYATWLNGSLEQAIAVARSAEQVISLRSGLCDILADLGPKLHVIYPHLTSYQSFGLEGIFGPRGVHEYIFQTPEKLLAQLGL